MTKLTLYVPKLVASLEDRLLSGLLLPFGEKGYTNLGALIASEDTKLDVAPMVTLNKQHNSDIPLGKAEALVPTPEGILAAFKVLPTRDGDDALAEAAAGVRTGLSVELDPVVVRAGRIISGTIVAAGHVVEPAFASARLAAAELEPVPDMGDTPAEPDPTAPKVVIDGEELEDVEAVTVSENLIDITTKTPDAAPASPVDTEEGNPMTAAVVQNAALVAAQPKTADKNALFAAFAKYGQTRMLAALSDVVPGNILGMEQPQYVGQLWSGKAYTRKTIPLFNHGDLTSFKVSGWRFVTKPVVGLYTGNKTAIPSAGIATEAVDVDAQRIAGGHDIDRKFRDFGNAEFWEAYFKAMTESYAKISDGYVLTEVLTASPYTAPGAVPAGVAKAMSYIVDGALGILGATDTMPTFAEVSLDLWRSLVLTRSEDALAYLTSALNLEDGTAVNFAIKPSAALAADTVLVGCKDAVTVHELGGEAPIRVEALDVAKGGVDEALFGYVAVNVHEEGGLALVSGTDPNA